MTDIIHLLPDSVANQIAAGEVIQRPASVIKELVENSIDAGATEVQVFITDAGRTCIQVIDNGKGMSETDARLSFERHATSKIQKADDLFALTTMGFRGEALASIAAIAEVELRTRRPEDEIGTAITVEGSRVTSQEPINCPVGANFAVRNLFYNIPVRRKFLKSNHTELANIVAEFERITIAHPDVAFTLTSNDQQMLRLPAGNFHQRVLGLFGKKVDKNLLPVSTDTDLVRVAGFVGTPESAKKKGAHQFFVVNSRYMRHPYFAKAIQMAYERLIPEAYQVPFFLCLEVDPAQIDVNVHPTKTEIKFTDEQDIFQIILVAVREALGKHNAIPSLDFTATDRPDIPAFVSPLPTGGMQAHPTPPRLHINPNFNPFNSASPQAESEIKSSQHDTSEPLFFEPQAQQPSATLWDTMPEETPQPQAVPLLPDGAEYYQYRGQYILTASEQGLLLIDQHRASERVLYDQYLRRLNEGKCATQGLLFPQIITLSPTLASVAEILDADLTNIGFNISNLGAGNYSILGIPVGTEGLDPVALLESILDEAQTTVLNDAHASTNVASEMVHHIIAATMARKAAMPVGEVLSQEEMSHLCSTLNASSMPGYTPDGRPIIVTLSSEHIARLFV